VTNLKLSPSVSNLSSQKGLSVSEHFLAVSKDEKHQQKQGEGAKIYGAGGPGMTINKALARISSVNELKKIKTEMEQ